MSDATLEQDTPTNTGQADYGTAESEAKTETSEFLNKDKIDALDTENFDAVDYQEDGQGSPKAGLKAELED